MDILCKKVETIIGMKGYLLKPDVVSDEYGNKTYVFNIYNKDGIIITNLQMVITRGNITGKTRSSFKEEDVFQINWVSTNQEYRGQQLATLVIIYSICYMVLNAKNIQYVILDDDSDKSIYMKKNIYNSLGFIPRDLVALNMTKSETLNILGPEKQLAIDYAFIRNANVMLDAMANGIGANGMANAMGANAMGANGMAKAKGGKRKTIKKKIRSKTMTNKKSIKRRKNKKSKRMLGNC